MKDEPSRIKTSPLPSKLSAWGNALAITSLSGLVGGFGCFILLANYLAGDGMIIPSECLEQGGQRCLVILPPTDRFRVDRLPDLAEARGPDRAFE